MKRRIWAAIWAILLALTPTSAPAAQAFPREQAPQFLTCSITVGTAVTCVVPSRGGNASNTTASQLVGIYNNNSAAAQTVTVACFDNASAASGKAYNFGVLGISQQITIPPPGFQLLNGLTCLASGAPAGEILVEFY